MSVKYQFNLTIGYNDITEEFEFDEELTEELLEQTLKEWTYEYVEYWVVKL